MTDGTTLAERYLSASHTSDMSGATLDVLLATGWAAQEPRRHFGAVLYRLLSDKARPGLSEAAKLARNALQHHTARGGRKHLHQQEQEALVGDVLAWWINPTCRYCSGHGHQQREHAAALYPKACKACAGVGRVALDRVVPGAYLPLAQHLEDVFNQVTALVFAEVARSLNGKMDEALGVKHAAQGQ